MQIEIFESLIRSAFLFKTTKKRKSDTIVTNAEMINADGEALLGVYANSWTKVQGEVIKLSISSF